MARETNVNSLSGSEAVSTSGDRDGNGAAEARLELWTRRPVCGPRTELIDRLGSLRSAGHIAAFCVETWPDEVVISEHTRHTRVIETYERFQTWAEQAGVSISPPFDRRTVTTLVGHSEEVLTLPVLCLAVYDDDDLFGVYPCSDGDDTLTVTDFIDAVGAGETVLSPADLTDFPD